MASTYVNDLRLNEMATGDASGSWGTVTNTNLELIGEAFSYGTETIGDADSTLTIADGAADAARSFYLKITSSVDLTTTRIVTLGPNTVSKVWMIENATTGSQVITIKQGSGATINVPNGQVKMISTDGAGSGGAVLDLLVDVDLTGTTTAVNLDVSGTALVTGVLTTTAATVSNGGGQFNGAINVGVDDTGYDVKFFGATAGAYMLWDESADDLILGGAAGLSVNSTALVTGVLTTTAATVHTGGITMPDNAKAIFGDSSDLQIYHTGTYSLIADTSGTGPLRVVTNTFQLNNAADTQNMIAAAEGGAVTLYNAGNAKLATTATGIDVTGTVVAGAGTALLPSITTTGDLNTGMWFPAADTIAFSEGGVEALRIDSSGGLITNPAAGGHAVFNEAGVDADFRVESDGNANMLFVDGGANYVGIGSATNYSAKLAVEGTKTLSAGIPNYQLSVIDDTAMGAGNGGAITLWGKYTTAGSYAEGASIEAYKSNGTSTNYQYGMWLKTRTHGGSMDDRLFMDQVQTVFNETGADTDFRVESDTNTHALFVEGSSGNVGIGTSSPSFPLSIQSNSSAEALLILGRSADDIGEIAFRENDNSTALGELQYRQDHAILRHRVGDLRFATGGTLERMRIDSSGNVGIGTSSPSVKLEVAGAAKLTNGNLSVVPSTATQSAVTICTNTGGSFFAGLDSSTGSTFGVGNYSAVLYNGANTPLVMFINGTERLRIGTNGYVGFGLTTPTTMIHLNGGTAGNSNSGIAAAWNVHSDYRLKENVVDLSNASSLVSQLRPVKFSWIGEDQSEATTAGFIAHEMAEVAPYSVMGEKDAVNEDGSINSQAADYSKLVPLLTAALQEALNKIDAMETRLSALEG
jgi:hypothetical protein